MPHSLRPGIVHSSTSEIYNFQWFNTFKNSQFLKELSVFGTWWMNHIRLDRGSNWKTKWPSGKCNPFSFLFDSLFLSLSISLFLALSLSLSFFLHLYIHLPTFLISIYLSIYLSRLSRLSLSLSRSISLSLPPLSLSHFLPLSFSLSFSLRHSLPLFNSLTYAFPDFTKHESPFAIRHATVTTCAMTMLQHPRLVGRSGIETPLLARSAFHTAISARDFWNYKKVWFYTSKS